MTCKNLSINAVLDLFSISKMTLWRWLKNPDVDFPKPIWIGGSRYWVESEIADFQARTAASRDATAPADQEAA